MELLTISGLILGLGLGIKLYTFYKNKQKAAFRKVMEEAPVPVMFPIDETTTCSAKSEPHQWEELSMMNMGKGTMTSLVCMKCGVINGTESQFSQTGLEKIRKQQKMIEEAKAFAKELEDFRAAQLKRIMAESCFDSVQENRFKSGYDAFLQIEDMVAEKIQEKKRQVFQEALAKIEGIKKD